MVNHAPLEDAILGLLQFDPNRKTWRSEFVMPDGKKVRLSITPEDFRDPLESQGLSAIQDAIHWLQQNEFELRLRVARKVFDHWKAAWAPGKDKIDELPNPQTPEDFAEYLSLSGVNVDEECNAEVFYRDGNLYGGHSLYLTIAPDGSTVYEPNLFG